MKRYAAIVLAAGQGSRFRAAGGDEPTKLVADYAGQTLVGRVVRSALAARVDPVIVVTGHAQDVVVATLATLDVRRVHNPGYAIGLSGSLKAGVMALPSDAAGAVILLGDMPCVSAAVIDRIVEEAQAYPQADAVVPLHRGRRGNPVLIARTLISDVLRLEGDAGARFLLQRVGLHVREVAFDRQEPLFDVDIPLDLDALRQIHEPS